MYIHVHVHVYSSSSLPLSLTPSPSLPFPPSTPLPHSCQANMDQPELASKITSSLKVSSSKWVSRYRPGVPVPMSNARESIVQAELRQREKDFCDKMILRYILHHYMACLDRAPPSLCVCCLLSAPVL